MRSGRRKRSDAVAKAAVQKITITEEGKQNLAAMDLRLPAVFPGLHTKFLENLQLQKEKKDKK